MSVVADRRKTSAFWRICCLLLSRLLSLYTVLAEKGGTALKRKPRCFPKSPEACLNSTCSPITQRMTSHEQKSKFLLPRASLQPLPSALRLSRAAASLDTPCWPGEVNLTLETRPTASSHERTFRPTSSNALLRFAANMAGTVEAYDFGHHKLCNDAGEVEHSKIRSILQYFTCLRETPRH